MTNPEQQTPHQPLPQPVRRLFIGSYIPWQARTRHISPPRHTTHIAPYPLPRPRGRRVVPATRMYDLDAETRWKTQYNARRSGPEVEEEEVGGAGGVDGGGSGVKGEVGKEVRFEEMVIIVNYVQGENDSDSDSSESESESDSEDSVDSMDTQGTEGTDDSDATICGSGDEEGVVGPGAGETEDEETIFELEL